MKIPRSIRLYPSLPFIALAAALCTPFAARADYNSVVLADTPLAFYALNPTNSSTPQTFPDLTGNGNDGSAFNISPVAGPSAFIPNATFFDGSTGAVDLGQGSNPTLLNFAGPITMEAWAKPTNSAWFGNIVAKGYDANFNYSEIVIRVNGPYGANYYASSGHAGLNGGSQVPAWTHLVLSSDGTNTTFYVNNVVVGTSGDTLGSTNFPDAFRIGTGSADGTGRYFDGAIAEVAIYNHGLSAAQVQRHYYAGLYGVTTLDNSIPIIATQPQGQSTYPGGSVSFSVQVTSSLPTTNQWFKGVTALTGQTNSTLSLNNVQAGDVAAYHVVIGNSNGTTNSASANLTLLTVGNSLLWGGIGNSGVWDTGSSPNWINQANSQQVVFNSGDQVLLDDSQGAPTTVGVSGTVNPSYITVNTASNYLINGSGTISGPASFIKQGPGSVTINSGANFTGPASITGGTVVAGNSSFTSVSSVTVTNNSTFDFGGSSIENAKPFTVSGTGVGGEGAIFNSGSAIYTQVLNVRMAGNTTFGALSGGSRWDFGNGSTLSGAFNVTINGHDSGGYTEWDTVNLDPNLGDIEVTQGALGLKGLGLNLGNPNATITIDAGGQLVFWNSNFGTNSGYSKNIHILTNGVFAFRTSPSTFLNGNVVLEGGAQWDFFNGGGNGQTMNGTFTLNGPTHMLIGDSTVTFANVISGPGGFVWDAYNNVTVFTASNTYTGPTVIGGGGLTLTLTGNGSISHSTPIFFGGSTSTNVALDVTGRPDHTLTLTSGQILEGVGTVNGSIAMLGGSAISPGGTNVILGMTEGANAVGTLAASSNITLNGNTVIKLNGSGVNDAIQAGGAINYGGILNLANISGSPLANGNSFQIFNAAVRNGTFTSINPATPGSGLGWDISQLNQGIIGVNTVVHPTINNPVVSGGNIILNGANGTANGTFLILTTTNLVTTPWSVLSTNSFDSSGVFHVTNAITPGVPAQFYKIQEQ